MGSENMSVRRFRKILFLCDRKKCGDHCLPECRHTSDPKHAINFQVDLRESDPITEVVYVELEERRRL